LAQRRDGGLDRSAIKHNAFDAAMDAALFEILGELARRRDVRAVIWRGEGKSFSSGRDVSADRGRPGRGLPPRADEARAPRDLAAAGHRRSRHRGDERVVDRRVVPAGAAVRYRVAAAGARMVLPEVGHGIIPDTGGVARLYQMCGHSVVSDMVLTGRPMQAERKPWGMFPHEDMTGDIKANLSRASDKDACQPAMRTGRLRELGWAATFLASPYARFISGHTLVVDGANWQRRSLTNPPVVPVRAQMGKAPFEP
jgi:hypothetical protein